MERENFYHLYLGKEGFLLTLSSERNIALPLGKIFTTITR